MKHGVIWLVDCPVSNNVNMTIFKQFIFQIDTLFQNSPIASYFYGSFINDFK